MSSFTWLARGITDDPQFTYKVMLYVLLVISFTCHEYGHAWVAKRCGDDTAERLGRLTLNPIVHMHPILSVALPLFMIFGPAGMVAAVSGVALCGAKPVPVNPANLRQPTRDMMLVSIAGPAVNVLLALFFTGAYWFHTQVRHISWQADSSLIFYTGIALNLQLAIFNMLPIPPLDGHRVLGYFLPASIRTAYYQIGFGGIVILLLLMRQGYLHRVLDPLELTIGAAWTHLMPHGTPNFFER